MVVTFSFGSYGFPLEKVQTSSGSMLAAVAGAGVPFPGCPAESDVHDVCGNDGQYTRDEEEDLVIVEHLFQDEHKHAECKHQDGSPGMMVFFEAVRQRVESDASGQNDHEIFKCLVVDQIFSEQRQTGQHQWQDCAVNSANDGRRYSQCVEIHPHHDVKV